MIENESGMRVDRGRLYVSRAVSRPVPYVPGPDLRPAWARQPLGCYPPVQVPENSSSIPGVEDKTDHGLWPVVVMFVLATLIDAAIIWATR
jgi:hypothetical protein